MKKIRLITILAALSFGMGSVQAIIINISNDGTSLTNGVPQGLVSGGSPTDLLDYLKNPIIPKYNEITGSSLALPGVSTSTFNDPSVDVGAGDNTVDITGYDYAAIHYGQMYVFYYLNGMTGNHTFDASTSTILDNDSNPGVDNPGNGPSRLGTQQGISNIRLYGPGTSVPDSGSTLLLLGLGLGVLGFLRRRK